MSHHHHHHNPNLYHYHYHVHHDHDYHHHHHQADTGLVRPYGLAALGEPQGAGEAVEVDF